jgi:hypothetical protein
MNGVYTWCPVPEISKLRRRTGRLTSEEVCDANRATKATVDGDQRSGSDFNLRPTAHEPRVSWRGVRGWCWPAPTGWTIRRWQRGFAAPWAWSASGAPDFSNRGWRDFMTSHVLARPASPAMTVPGLAHHLEVTQFPVPPGWWIQITVQILSGVDLRFRQAAVAIAASLLLPKYFAAIVSASTNLCCPNARSRLLRILGPGQVDAPARSQRWPTYFRMRMMRVK